MKTIKMKKADWEKWDTALRSGEYRQGQGKLFDSYYGEYCCLGVLQHCLTGEVEVAYGGESELLPTPGWLERNGIFFLPFDYRGEVITEKDRTAANPRLIKLSSTAADANDRGSSFVEIADAIKEVVEFTDEG